MTNPHTQPAPTEPKPVPDAEPSDAEIAKFMQECDAGLHPLSAEDEAALAKVSLPARVTDAARESETPETDAAVRSLDYWMEFWKDRLVQLAHAELCRSLERRLTQQAGELSALRVERDEAKRIAAMGQTATKTWNGMFDDLVRLRADLSSTLAQLAEMKVERDEAQETIRYVAGQLIEAGCDDGARPIHAMARCAVTISKKLDTALADRDAARKEVEPLWNALSELKRQVVEVILPNTKNITLDIGQLALWELCVKETDAALRAAPEREG